MTAEPPAERRGSLAIHGMVALGGLAALSWETIWQLQATLSFGLSAIGAALTLAATMGGMTVGALAMGAWLRRRNDPLDPVRVYGFLELTIGATGLLALPGFALLQRLDALVYAGAPALAAPLHLGSVFVLLAPATFAMGATVPVFQLIAATRNTRISTLYAINTGGAALGVLVMSFVVLPAIGVRASCLLLAAVNAAVFVASRLSSRASVAAHGEPAPQSDRTQPAYARPAALAVVACTGFVTFGLEVAWFRALRSAFWSTSSTFAILLASVLIALAIGARIVPMLRARGFTPSALLVASGCLILLSTPLVERMDLAIAVDGAYAFVMSVWFALTLVVIGPAIVCLATALPWCLEDHRDPHSTSLLYGVNALGSVAGSLVAAWGLLPLAGVAATAWLLGLSLVVVAIATGRASLRSGALVATGACLAVAAFATSSPGRHRIQGRLDFDGHTVLVHRENADFTTSVIETPEKARHLLIDGFVATSDHGTSTSYMYWMGSLPALLVTNADDGLVICFGTGQTANGMRRERMKRIDVVELSERIYELAPYFEANENVLADPRIQPVVMDGRAWLRRHEGEYDAITLEPMPPNFSGVNALYSREFYEIVSTRLKPLGVVAQWLPIHMLTHEHARSIAATFVEAFPDSILWFDPIGGTGILLGRKSGAVRPLGEVWPGFARENVERPLSPGQIRRSIWLDQAALRRYVDGAEVVTDDNQLLQFGQLRPAQTSERALRLNQENMRVLANFAGRGPFLMRTLPAPGR